MDKYAIRCRLKEAFAPLVSLPREIFYSWEHVEDVPCFPGWAATEADAVLILGHDAADAIARDCCEWPPCYERPEAVFAHWTLPPGAIRFVGWSFIHLPKFAHPESLFFVEDDPLVCDGPKPTVIVEGKK